MIVCTFYLIMTVMPCVIALLRTVCDSNVRMDTCSIKARSEDAYPFGAPEIALWSQIPYIANIVSYTSHVSQNDTGSYFGLPKKRPDKASLRVIRSFFGLCFGSEVYGCGQYGAL